MPYIRTILKGSGVGEIFQIGAVQRVAEAITEADLNEYTANVVGAWAGGSWSGLFRTYLSGDQAYDGVSAYGYNVSPDQPADATASSIIGAAQGVGLGPRYLPLQVALVVTTRTENAGASYRGRMYFPCDGSDFAAGHVLSQAQVDLWAQEAANYLDSLTSAWAAVGAHDPGQIVVWSTKKGVGTDVTHVSVDNRPDIQRRRAESQHATAVGTSLLPPGGP